MLKSIQVPNFNKPTLHNMKNIIKLAGVAVVVLALTQTPQAVPIQGNIGFIGGVTINSSSMGTATAVTGWVNPTVQNDFGTFATPSPYTVLPGAAVTFAAGNWNFHTSVPINNFWSVGDYTFQLLSSVIVSQVGGAIVVAGTGVASVTGANPTGYTPTTMSWSFTSQDPKSGVNPDQWSFSASTSTPNAVPDGGATVMQIGRASCRERV